MLPGALIGLLACSTTDHASKGPDTSTTPPATTEPCFPPLGVSHQVTWTDDGLLPTDTDADGAPDTGCGDSLEIRLWPYQRTATPDFTWSFGLVGTSPGARVDEACLAPDGDPRCHTVGLVHELHQVADCDPANLELGATTLLDASAEPRLGYVIANNCGCATFGEGSSFYLALGCVDLP